MIIANTPLLELSEMLTVSPSFSGEMDADIFSAAVSSAQEYYLAPLLGAALYARVLSEYASPSTPIENLLPYIKRCLAQCVQLDFLGMSGVQVVAYGVVQKRTDFSDTSENYAQKRAADTVRGKMQAAEQRILNFLKDNATLFPEYNTCEQNGGGKTVPYAVSVRKPNNNQSQLNRR